MMKMNEKMIGELTEGRKVVKGSIALMKESVRKRTDATYEGEHGEIVGKGQAVISKLQALQLAMVDKYPEAIVDKIRRAVRYNYKHGQKFTFKHGVLKVYDGEVLILNIAIA